MIIKTISKLFYLVYLLSILACNKEPIGEIGKSQNFEKLGVAKMEEYHMTSEQIKDMEKSVTENFDQAFQNSSPEVQQAMLKAAKELELNKSMKKRKPASQ